MKQFWKMLAIGLCLAVTASTFAGCANGNNVTVRVSGSSSVTPLMEALAAEYEKTTAGVTIMISSSDSSGGVKDAIDGTSHIGMASRKLKSSETEQGVTGTKIATDGIACIVNAANTDLTTVTGEQLYALYQNGDALSATVTKGVARESGSGTRDGFDGLVKNADGDTLKEKSFASVISEANSTSAVVTAVKSDASKFGYISFGSVSNEVKILQFEGVAPSETAIRNGSYQLQRDFTLAISDSLQKSAGDAVYRAVTTFVSWILESDAAHAIITAKGCVNL